MENKRVALVTGAAQGIGAAVAMELSGQNYQLALLDRDARELEKVGEKIRAAGGRALALPVDLSDLERTEAAVERTARELGGLDVLVNNAAWRKVETMRETELATWRQTLEVCPTAPAFLAKWAAAVMERKGAGVIINVCSIRSEVPDGRAAAYAAAKGGLESLTYDLAALYGPRGIRVVAFSPGAIDTTLSHDLAEGEAARQVVADCIDRAPLGRLGRPEEMARAIAFLASDAASFITGTTLVADGGLTRNGTGLRLKQLAVPEQFS
jgi:3-oxoacyl-[acyl-carrier protein] reductase